MKKSLLKILVFLIGFSALHAELIERDLGEGLVYFRTHTLPADLPPPGAKTGPMVLDLRFTKSEESGDKALDAWLKFRATASTPVIVLINSETAPDLRLVAAHHKSTAGIVMLGESSTELTADIPLAKAGEPERVAYAALENGATLESLIVENAGKPRIDEATIMHDRANPPSEFTSADPLELNDGPAVKPDASPAVLPSAPVIDFSLQRAVQIHRALLALKRL
jgi:hypothetical protein